MLDLKFVCENIELVKDKLAKRHSNLDLTELTLLAQKRKETIKKTETLKAEKNKVSAEVAVMKKNKQPCDDIIAEMKKKGEEIKALDDELAETESKLTEIMYVIPNLVDDSLPVG